MTAELLKNVEFRLVGPFRGGRVGAVAEYMLAPLGVPATGLSRAKGIVAWTGPSGY